MMEYVVAYFTVLITFITYIGMYKIFNKEKINFNIVKFVIINIFTLISTIITFTNMALLNLIINIILVMYLLKLIYNISLKKTCFYSLNIIVITLLCDSIVSLIMSNAFLKNFALFRGSVYLRALLSIPVYILSMIFCFFPFVKKIINDFYKKFFCDLKLNKSSILSITLIFIILITGFCFNGYNKVSKIGHIYIIILMTILILSFLIIVYILYTEYQINLVNKKILEENNYIKTIAKQEEEFKHNLINNLLGIKTVSTKKTNKLIDELINDYRQDYKNITNINDLPNGIQSIIYRKAYDENIEDLNLVVENSIKKELYDILSPRKYNHLCTSIGILFDNALEAVRNMNEKVIEISFIEDKENVYFLIKNSFSNYIDLEEFGKRNFTTKSRGHGIGIKYIKKLKTLDMKNEIINNMFINKIVIKKTKKI